MITSYNICDILFFKTYYKYIYEVCTTIYSALEITNNYDELRDFRLTVQYKFTLREIPGELRCQL